MSFRKEPYRKGGVIYEKIYEFTLYPDSTSYDCSNVIEWVKDNFPFWAIILHDSDVNLETGELKKAHYHVLFKADNRISINSVSKNSGVPVNDIEWKADLQESVQYLTHCKHKEKHQYDIGLIESNEEDLEHKFFKSASVSETDQVKLLFDYINTYSVSKMVDLMAFALDNNCYSALRRGASLFNSLLRDNERLHIEAYKKENNNN